MSLWIYILIGIAVVVLIMIMRRKKASSMPVLKTIIGTPNGLVYQVRFEKLHPEMKEIEYVRMILNFTAKMLFVIDKKHDYVSAELIIFIKNVSQSEMSPTDIDKLLPKSILIQEGIPNRNLIEGVLYFKNMQTRDIITQLPSTWLEHQLAHSVMALIKSTIDILDDEHRGYLKRSLKYMSESYDKGVNPRDMRNMLNLPNEAIFHV